jgi:hypothetical protein
MNAMTCNDVEQLLDLHAAGEGDQLTRQAVEQHLQSCPACSASYAQSRRVLGRLDLHWSAGAEKRLHARIDAEARRLRRHTVLPFVRGAAALAAVLLLSVGLISSLSHTSMPQTGIDLQLAWAPAPALVRETHPESKGSQPATVRSSGEPAAFQDSNVEAITLELQPDQTGAAFRQTLEQARGSGNPPLPPTLPLALAVKNTGNRPLWLRLGNPGSELSIEVHGDDVVRIPAPHASEPDFLHEHMVKVRPGEEYAFRIERLIAGSRGNIEYIYLTEPGEYTIRARLRLMAGNEAVTLTSGTVHVKAAK